MIPLLTHVRIVRSGRRGFGLWLPLLLVWLLILPFAVLLLPLFFAACLVGRVNPFRALSVLWRLLASLGGTRIEIGNIESSVLVRIV